MRQVGFDANLKDPMRQRVEWIRKITPTMHSYIGLSWLCSDYFLSFSMSSKTDDKLGMYRDLNLRFREPCMGGGGFYEGFFGIANVFRAMRELAEQPHLPFPCKSVKAAPWVYRTADEGYGVIGVAIAKDGSVLFAGLPFQNGHYGEECEYGVMLVFSPSNTPKILYDAWVSFYQGVSEDNKKGFMGGNHA
jgi:hypothetical protein